MNTQLKQRDASTRSSLSRLWEVLRVSFMLGLTSFGGPIAHLGYFHNEYVKRRKWLEEQAYADLVALCQFLPGPASSQVGIGIGILRAGWLGGIAAWIGFTMPSIAVLVMFALLLGVYEIGDAGWLHGLKLVAVAVVAQAVWGMSQKLSAGSTRAVLTLGALVCSLIWPSAWTQVAVIAAAGVLGMMLLRSEPSKASFSAIPIAIGKVAAVLCLVAFALLLLLLPLAAAYLDSHEVSFVDSYYRAGALVFGGGHVVLPLLEAETVPHWLSHEEFLAGYGAAQAVPGPLFTFASYLGMVSDGWLGAVLATLGIFLPAFLLIYGTLPFWGLLRSKPGMQAVLAGVNAAVVGILLAALYDPIWVSAVEEPKDAALASILFAMLIVWKLPPWVVVLAGALAGAAFVHI